MRVGKLCVAFFSWRKKVLCISRDWPTLLQPGRTTTAFSKGAGGATSWDYLLNYGPTVLFPWEASRVGVYSKFILHPHFSPSLWTAERPM